MRIQDRWRIVLGCLTLLAMTGCAAQRIAIAQANAFIEQMQASK